MQSAFVTFNNARLHYLKAGMGPKIMLLFHGFGQDHRVFHPLMQAISAEYTTYAVDTFFHGNSKWKNGESPLEKKEWGSMVNQLLHDNSIEGFSMLGFSMGGKFALATLEAFPQRIEDLILLAPDGVRTSFWYSLATYPIALRHLFKSMIEHPDRFQKIAAGARWLGLIDKGVLRFVESQMNTKEKRWKVYHSWVVFRHFAFDLKAIAKLLNTNPINLTLLVGRFDKIITAENMSVLLNEVRSHRLEVLEAGHNDLIEKAVPAVLKLIARNRPGP